MDTVIGWIFGDLSTQARIWTALAPAILTFAYFIVTLVIYALRYAIWGPYRDSELEARPATRLTGLWVRLYFAWAMRPVWWAIMRAGVPANALTTLSVLLATGSGIALATGRFALGGWLYIISGMCDFLDGRVARMRNEVTKSGAALDSILDRYSDAAVLIGLAWFYRDSWVLLLVLAAMAGSSFIPYIRAKGEAAGVKMNAVGMMQRAERILYLGFAVGMSPILEAILVPNDPKPIHRLAVIGIVLLAISTQMTALHRLLYLLKELGGFDFRKTWLASPSGRALLVRNAVAATAATAADFTFWWVIVELELAGPVAAVAFGCALGATVNYSMNRIWTFSSTAAKLPQIGRYTFVTISSAFLNTGGVALLLMIPSIESWMAWVVARALVFLTWNYPLHRDYVFAEVEDRAEEPPPEPEPRGA